MYIQSLHTYITQTCSYAIYYISDSELKMFAHVTNHKINAVSIITGYIYKTFKKFYCQK